MKALPVTLASPAPALRRLSTGSPAQDMRNRQQQDDLRAPLSCPLLYGVQIECETPDVGVNLEIRHGLGRRPQGWFVVGQRDEPFAMLELYDLRTDVLLVLERAALASVDSRFSLWIY